MPVSRDDTVIMVFSGEYDLGSRARLRHALDSLVSVVTAVLDFTSVTYVDSTILSELTRMARARAERRLGPATLVVSDGNIARIFDLVELSRIFAIVGSLDDAVARNGKTVRVDYAWTYPDGETG